ncbi:Membrane-bound protease, CAAX family [Streptococcus sp. DD10]|uniref:CPBP family intramembrane glutamic endopeptidase n=1 Tax=Streptococcus sp. DD10 TaxID=1777878 RepID=UPI00079AEEDB|nr:type II CAAX endopeptidase family protein [Streptococcus sp. DD10]KXT74835.1 Membrane-bound protease, CAAX family [Streptococcus sp. DD10]
MKQIKTIGVSSLKIVGLILLTLLINSIPMYFLAYSASISLILEILFVILYMAFLIVIGKHLFSKYFKYDLNAKKKFRFGWKDVGFALLFGLLARVVAVLGVMIQYLLSGKLISANDASLRGIGANMSFQHPFFLVLFLFTLVVVAPVFEELVFRGFGNRLLFNKLVSWLGALVTSILFVLPHVHSWAEVPTYFMLALVCYASYARRGNVLDSIVVHMLNNLLPAIYIFLMML